MSKTFQELREILNGLYELKEEAEAAETLEERRQLGQRVFNGAMELLSSSGEFSPTLVSNDREGKERELARWKREIKWPAESLRDWFIKGR